MHKRTPEFSHVKSHQQIMSSQHKVDPHMNRKLTRKMDICRKNMTHNH